MIILVLFYRSSSIKALTDEGKKNIDLKQKNYRSLFFIECGFGRGERKRNLRDGTCMGMWCS